MLAGILLFGGSGAQAGTVVTESDGACRLSNGRVEAVFRGEGAFDIEKLVLNGHSVLDPGTNATPWILWYKGPQGENPELKPEHAVYQGAEIRRDEGAATLVFTWQLTLDYSSKTYPVRMYVTLCDDEELLRWSLEADLPEGWMVTDLHFPRLEIRRPADGRILTTEGWGVEKPLDITTFEARYPSHASAMQFLIVHNADGAFYYGTEDRRGCGKTYSARCSHETVLLSDAIPAVAPNESERKPNTGETRAPPETPIIINAESSLPRSGWCCKAYEKRIENTLAHESPIIAISTSIAHNASSPNSSRNAPTATSILTRK